MNRERFNQDDNRARLACVAIFGILSIGCFAAYFYAEPCKRAVVAGLDQLGRMPTVPGTPVLPSGLTAQQYYWTGQNYKANGWVELSRQAMGRAAALDPHGITGHSAEVFTKTCLPRSFVSHAAEQGNIEGYNMMAASNGTAAAANFKFMIERYPEFEWPMGNLAAMYLDENNLEEAEKLINRALEINPAYLNGLRYKAELKIKQKDYRGAEDAYQQALDALGPPERLEGIVRDFSYELSQSKERLKLARRRSGI